MILAKFKEIPGFESYLCNEKGQIYSLKSKKILKTDKRINNNGYESVALRINKKTIVKSVHWLIAITFLEYKEGLNVNHKDGNKRNNHITNLELVTRSENMKHAYKIGLVIPYDRSGQKNPNSTFHRLRRSNV